MSMFAAAPLASMIMSTALIFILHAMASEIVQHDNCIFFAVNTFHGACILAALCKVTHPSTGMLKSPENSSRSPAW